MQSAVGGRDNDLKMLRGLGMALQFQNPNFNASAFINNYKSNELAQIQNKWELLTAADKQGVERQLSQQMMDWSNANPAATDSDFRAWWDKLGFPNMSAMERTHKAWRQVNPLPELSKSMGFIDKEGLKHLGYVQYDKDRIPRYFLRDGSKVPEGWDMISQPPLMLRPSWENRAKRWVKPGRLRWRRCQENGRVTLLSIGLMK